MHVRVSVGQSRGWNVIHLKLNMNRLAVYSYLTRYPYGHTWFDRVFTAPLPDINIPINIPIPIESEIVAGKRDVGQDRI